MTSDDARAEKPAVWVDTLACMAFTLEQQVTSSLVPTRFTARLVDGKLQLPRG